ncbi:MAG: integrase arm-type DNA-binding domain-containing protein [Desulfovibrio sp.]|uniref:tyrosine-type recombinase/integrase n=1 Tax=Desulfovibrio sp. TaxID=885 RepID=UPI001A757C4E|nr:integrase arm-type DNA-binding domain-containing protein [Desulfovibrio sp.]MBD5417819.1 integrase arm-type DNA-binding domain-containing protein [Desulfovibrio sp.]
MPLTDTHIRSLKPEAKPRKYFDGGGLFLYVPPTGSKLWRLAYRFEGKSKLLSFGDYPAVSLKDARGRRDEAKGLLAKGIDPSAQKKAAKQEQVTAERDSFENIALDWHRTRLAGFSEKHQGTALYRLNTYILPIIGKKHIASLEAPEILALVKSIEGKGNHETARRVLQIIGQVFRFAIAMGKIKHNIAADLHGALRPRKVVHRAAVLGKEKVAHLLMAIDEYAGYYPLVCALKLAPMLFVRPTELRCATWQEFDLDAAEWRIPAERMKMRRTHIVPLSRQALTILKELKKFSGEGQYLFPSTRTETRPISDATMLNALRRMGYQKHEMSVHGFRSIASTLLNELCYNRDWIERQLAHGDSNGVRAAYNYAEYLPERKRMMQEWSDFLDSLRDKSWGK